MPIIIKIVDPDNEGFQLAGKNANAEEVSTLLSDTFNNILGQMKLNQYLAVSCRVINTSVEAEETCK